MDGQPIIVIVFIIIVLAILVTGGLVGIGVAFVKVRAVAFIGAVVMAVFLLLWLKDIFRG